MTTGQQWVDQVKDYVLGGVREEIDVLAAAIVSTSATTFTSTDAVNGLQAGAEVEIDLERMYVRSVAGTTVTVLRGFRGTTAATHLIGSVVTVNPIVSNAAAMRELNNELAALSSPANGLYKIGTVDLTWSGATVGYDLTSVADIEDVLEVRWKEYGSYANWPVVPPSEWELARNMSTSEFASGSALLFRGGVEPGRTVRVRYRAPFTAISALSDNVESVSGLPASAVDIPVLGAAGALKGWTESRRSIVGQGDPRHDEDVPSGSAMRSGAWFLQRRQQRIAEEASRLVRDFPTLLAR